MDMSGFNNGINGGISSYGASTSTITTATHAEVGPDLEDILTEGIGFQSLAGDAKIQLLPNPWPSDALPPPTSSLLSFAPSKGLLAAAGPSELIVASTKSVREAYTGDRQANSNTRSFTPELTIRLPTRVSQVAFTTDEKYLVVSAETNGGLAVYDVQQIMQGNQTPAFEINTLGVSLRALAPNPSVEKSSFLALVTTNGDLLITNLDSKQLVTGSNGPVLKSGVSCICWSRLGKQLVAGLGNGSAYQLTPEGVGKAEIPKPPSIQGDDHVSSIIWLETHSFLVVHTPTTFDKDSIPPSEFHLITRQNANYLFQKLTEPCFPMGLNRSPPYHFISRLREFPPNLKDALVISSTGSTDIGLLTLSATPLTGDVPADKITNVFTMTGPADDTRRAQLPMVEDAAGNTTETSPIGAGFDLSVKEKAIRPIPSEEIDESATPLPAYLVLNNAGILSAWWFVYSESVRQGMVYPELVKEGLQQANQQQQAVAGFGASQAAAPTFGGAAFGSSTPPSTGVFGASKPLAPAFGSPSQPTTSSPSNTFGATSAFGGSFGAPAILGNRPSAFGAVAASRSIAPTQNPSAGFGQPAFGSSSTLGANQTPSFGSVGGIGAKSSPWTTPNTPAGNGTATQPAAATFGSTTTTGGFGSYANMGGFAAVAAQPSSGSIFSQQAESNPSNDTEAASAFGASNQNQTGLFGSSPSGFTLGSIFKGDGSAKDDGPKPNTTLPDSFFGSTFSGAFSQDSKIEPAPGSPISKEANMDDEESADEEISRPTNQGFVVQKPSTPPTIPFGQNANAFSRLGSSPASRPNLFEASKPVELAADSDTNTSQIPKEDEKSTILPESTPASPEIKPEPRDDSESPVGVNKSIPEAPLPPDTTSKTSYVAGDSSASSSATQRAAPEDAPLPPDFVTSKPSNTTLNANEILPPDSTTPKKERESIENETRVAANAAPSDESSKTSATDAPLPPDLLPPSRKSSKSEDESNLALPEDADEGFDDEGSGEDVARDVSIDVTPESSFAESFDRSPVGGRFTNIPRHPHPPPTSRPLFGEIGSNAVPFLPPPSKKEPESPRSPSPVRGIIPSHRLRPESSRSVSAPNSGYEESEARPGLMRPPLPNGSISKMAQLADERRLQERQRAIELRAKQVAEEEQDLNDEHDEQVREELASEVQPTRDLRPFLAHQDYVGDIEKPGIPGQVERVYRDINSMIDTLGLNARSLEAFVKGHSEGYEEGGRTKDDLENEDGWCLIEVEDLSALEHEIAGSLDAGRVRNVREKLLFCQDLLKDLVKIRTKHNEVKYLLSSHTSPEHVAALRAQPLSAEQSLQLHDLRQQYTAIQQHLAEAEECLTLLRAKISSVNGASNSKPTPTVEAVMNTIVKMTSLVEKKSGDIDVLESQMRKLRFSSVNSTQSREESPARFFTPQKTYASPMRTPGSGAQLFFTPQSRFSSPSRFGYSVGSPSPFEKEGTPVRKKLDGITTEDVQRSRSKLAARKKVVAQLREAVIKAGAHVRKVDY